MILFLVGIIGFLVLSLFLAQNPFDITQMGETTRQYTGTLGALLGTHLMLPYIIFCGIGLIGLWSCIYEIYFRGRAKKYTPEKHKEEKAE